MCIRDSYYVILITNYSNSACNISFNQTGGSGSTDCCVTSNISIIETIADVSCNNFSDGLIDLNVTGGNPPFTTNWSNGVTTNLNSNLNSGTYTATITDTQVCTSNETYTLSNPPIFSPITNFSNINCFGDNDGLIEFVNEPASTTYLWSTTSTTSSLNNLGL